MNRIFERILYILFYLVCAALIASAFGCAKYRIDVPPNFVELEEPGEGYALRASDAHGVVLSVRKVPNEGKGSLAFWTEAVKNQVRTLGGYALLEEKRVRARSGHPGAQLRFGRDEHGATHEYWVTLFRTKKRVFIVEAGARRDRFASVARDLERAIASFEVKSK